MTTNEVRRVYGNIAVLLSQGTFAGSAAGALAEAQHFITGFLTQLDAATTETPANDGQQAS